MLDRLEAVVFDTDGVLTDTAGVHAADRLGLVVEVDRGGQVAALAERGADMVVADLGDLILEGAVAGRGGG